MDQSLIGVSYLDVGILLAGETNERKPNEKDCTVKNVEKYFGNIYNFLLLISSKGRGNNDSLYSKLFSQSKVSDMYNLVVC